jgi:GNAT superfamily N-acetyltransferase
MLADFRLRVATPGDAPDITALIERSVHGLGAGDYSQAQREGAIGQVFLVDHGLIADGSYFVVMSPDGRMAGAGGWSNRKALHGGHVHGDTGARVDPARDPARIRAFFVDPDFARLGVGSIILAACEAAARGAGFSRAALGATLTGVRFYARHGYREVAREDAALPDGLSLTVVLMEKSLRS